MPLPLQPGQFEVCSQLCMRKFQSRAGAHEASNSDSRSLPSVTACEKKQAYIGLSYALARRASCRVDGLLSDRIQQILVAPTSYLVEMFLRNKASST